MHFFRNLTKQWKHYFLPFTQCFQIESALKKSDKKHPLSWVDGPWQILTSTLWRAYVVEVDDSLPFFNGVRVVCDA